MTKQPSGVDRGRLIHKARHGDREQREQAADQLKALGRKVTKASALSQTGPSPDNTGSAA